MLARGPFGIFDDLLARACACSGCLSHLPVGTMSRERSLIKYRHWEPQALTSDTR